MNSYVVRIEVGDVDGFLEISEHLFGIHNQPLVVTEGEAGTIEVGTEDGDLHPTHHRQLVGLLYESSLPLIEGVLFS